MDEEPDEQRHDRLFRQRTRLVATHEGALMYLRGADQQRLFDSLGVVPDMMPEVEAQADRILEAARIALRRTGELR